MRTFVELAALVSEDNEQLRRLMDHRVAFDDNDADKSKTFHAEVFTLAASAANVQVPFGGVTAASLMIIIAEDDVSVRLNANDAPLLPVRITPAPQTTKITSVLQKADQPGIVIWRGRVDSIYLTNPSSSATARVYVALVGEAS